MKLNLNRLFVAFLANTLLLLSPASTAYADDGDYELSNPVVATLDADEFAQLERPFMVEANETNTMLTFYYYCRNDVERIWVASEETVIMDPRTGTQYVARGIVGGNAKMCCDNIVRGKQGKVLEFKIEFPPLPRHMQRICLYGLPALNSIGEFSYRQRVFALDDICRLRHHQLSSDVIDFTKFLRPSWKDGVSVGWYSRELPPKQTPKLYKKPAKYDIQDMDTYPRYKNAISIRPYFTDYVTPRFAAWFTEDATYVAEIECCLWNGTFFRIDKTAYIQQSLTPNRYEETSEQLHIISAGDYPIDGTNYFIDGLAGDCVAIIMKFPPVPKDTRFLNIWINYEASAVHLPVSELLANQYLVKPFKRTVVK